MFNYRKGFTPTPIPRNGSSMKTKNSNNDSPTSYRKAFGRIGVSLQSKRGFIPYKRTPLHVSNLRTIFGSNTRDFRTGFTLVEILVVIAILTSLLAIFSRSYGIGILKARNAIRDQNIGVIMDGLALYRDKYGHFPCHEWYDESQSPNFLSILASEGFVPVEALRDPLNTVPNVFYYWSFKGYEGGPCGAGAFLGFTYKGPDERDECPYNGVLVTSSPTHCHILLPSKGVTGIPPTVCDDPYAEDGEGAWASSHPDCAALQDTAADNEY